MKPLDPKIGKISSIAYLNTFQCHIWVVVQRLFNSTPTWGHDPMWLANMFQGWSHQDYTPQNWHRTWEWWNLGFRWFSKYPGLCVFSGEGKPLIFRAVSYFFHTGGTMTVGDGSMQLDSCVKRKSVSPATIFQSDWPGSLGIWTLKFTVNGILICCIRIASLENGLRKIRIRVPWGNFGLFLWLACVLTGCSSDTSV